MATRKPGTVRVVNRADTKWRVDSTPIEMDGGTFVRWVNDESAEIRFVPEGMHPTDQPNAERISSFDVANVPTELDGESVEETAADRVAAMLRMTADDERAEIKVYRVVAGQLEYCAQFSPQEFEDGSFEMLRQRFGAGDYELRLYSINASKKYGLRSRTKLKIAADHSPVNAGMPAGMSQVLETIARGQQQMLDAMVAMKSAPQRDPMDEMSKMLTMMSLMREAMGINNQPAPTSSIGEIIKAVRELREVSGELNPAPEKEEPEGLMGMLPKVLELVSAARTPPAQAAVLSPVTIPESMQGTAMIPAQAPTPAEDAANPPAPAGPEYDPQTMTYIKLMAHVTHLCAMCDDKKSPDEGAQYVIDDCPDEIIDLLDMPDAVAQLSAMLPQVAQRAQWFESVRAAALALLDAPDPV